MALHHLIQHTQYCPDRRCTMSSNTPTVKNRAPLTTRSCSLMVNLQQSTTLQYSTPKRARENPESISQEEINHLILASTSRYQVCEKQFWKPSEDASQKSPLNEMSLKCHYCYHSVIFPCVHFFGSNCLGY